MTSCLTRPFGAHIGVHLEMSPRCLNSDVLMGHFEKVANGGAGFASWVTSLRSSRATKKLERALGESTHGVTPHSSQESRLRYLGAYDAHSLLKPSAKDWS